MKTKKHPSDMSAVDLIKYLNGRRGWHGSQYRSLCGEWLRKAEIRKQALVELAKDISSTNMQRAQLAAIIERTKRAGS